MNRPSSRARLRACVLALAVLWLAPAPAALGQVGGGNDQLTKILTDPDKLEELKKERLRPPIEFFRSQVMPNDVLPYIKANHWSMLGLELRSNHDDYEGMLQSRPVGLAGQPNEVVYRRDARLVKGQRARLTLPMLLPTIPKEVGLQLIRPEAIRQDEEWLAPLRVLEPHQQMVVVASKNPNDPYARWTNMRATTPTSGRKDDPLLADKQRYYRMVLPLEPDKPMLSSHPLTWSPISHLIWDGLPPEAIGVGQQQAILDWMHWGGQIVVVGGAGPAYAPLRESFLARYLPAEPSGENVLRSGAELKPLSEAYPPPAAQVDSDEPIASNISYQDAFALMGRRYRPPATIATAAKKPIYFAALRPKPGAVAIPLGGPDDPPLAVEWKVGRGRVIMLSFALTDPDLVGWPGFDTLVRRVVLRRPEEKMLEKVRQGASGGFVPPVYEPLNGLDLTTVRYLSRDLGAPPREALDEDGGKSYRTMPMGMQPSVQVPEVEVPVGEWLDSARLPGLAREKLEKASGIEIPSSRFVLKVILAYILALVPLNWLICRYVLGRREWAWVVVPTLSLAFAIGVERAAAYDVGYDSSCDEIDLIETQGTYSRGHLSRFASIYSTGRVRYTISYPNDPTALALPLATGRSLRGEDLSQSTFQTLPNPALSGFQVQPRSLALFRAEQMASLPGTVALVVGAEGAVVDNQSGLDLNDAWVVEVQAAGEKLKVARLGALAQGQKVPVGDLAILDEGARPPEGQLDPRPFLDLLLERSVAQRPEEVGELRLVAWAAKPMAGQAIDPPVDRQRGFTLVVAHLRPSPRLDPASPRYNLAVAGGELAPPEPGPAPGSRQGDPNAMINKTRGGRGGGRGATRGPVTTPAPTPPPPTTPDAPPTSNSTTDAAEAPRP